MLSPSMITRSNGIRVRAAAIWRATSYCTRSPVPLSPMTANRTALWAGAMPPPCRTPSTPRTIVTSNRTAHLDSERRPLSFFDPLAQPLHEPLGHGRFVSARAECVDPLRVTEAADEVGGPLHFLRRDAVLHQLAVPAVIVEFDEPVLDVGDERITLEELDDAALRMQARRFSERGPEIADDVPALDLVARGLHVVQRVVDVLEIRAVEHQENDEQSLVRFRADERVLLPGPLTHLLHGWQFQPESSARRGSHARFVAHRERREKVDRGLVIAGGRQHARQHHFDRTFGSLVVVRRLLHVPLAAFGIGDDHAGVRSVLLLREEGVGCVRIGRALHAPRSVEEIALWQVQRLLPEFGHVRVPGCSRRLHPGRAHRNVDREERRHDEQWHASTHGILPSRRATYGTYGATVRFENDSGGVNDTVACIPSLPRATSSRMSRCVFE